MQQRHILKLCCLLALIGIAQSTSNGAFPNACKNKKDSSKSITLSPGHRGITIEDDNPSADLKVDNPESGFLRITVSSEKPFKGFLIVVQDKDEKEGGTTIGEFVPGDRQKPLKCSSSVYSGITHANAEAKNEVVVNWTIPSDLDQSTVIVRATVVYSYSMADRLRTTYTIP